MKTISVKPVRPAGDHTVATLHLHDMPAYTKRGRNRVANWLEKQAAFLRNEGDNISKRFRARYILTSMILVCLFLTAGCNTVYKTAILVSAVEDSLMKEWARAHNDKLTTPQLDAQVINAHAKFNKAKLVAAAALRAYEAGGSKDAYFNALEALKTTLGPMFDLLNDVVSEAKLQSLKDQSALASRP